MISKLVRKGRRVVNQVEERGYVVERHEGPLGEPIAAFRGKVSVGNRTFPCDTALSLNVGDVPGGGRAEFTTFIYGGRQGENAEHLRQVVDNFSHDLHGKLVRDYTDDSHDVIYATSEPMSRLNRDLVIDNVHHHAQVKARILPHLKLLDEQLDLEPHTSLTDSERFAKDYMRTVKGLPSPPEIIYLPDPR